MHCELVGYFVHDLHSNKGPSLKKERKKEKERKVGQSWFLLLDT